MKNHNKEQINKEQISLISEKKAWAMPELIVIDKKVIESGMYSSHTESTFGKVVS